MPKEFPVQQRRRRTVGDGYVEDNQRRLISFSKRKKGLFKKAHEISLLTGCNVALFVVSENGHLFTTSTESLKSFTTNSTVLGLLSQELGGVTQGNSDHSLPRSRTSSPMIEGGSPTTRGSIPGSPISQKIVAEISNLALNPPTAISGSRSGSPAPALPQAVPMNMGYMPHHHHLPMMGSVGSLGDISGSGSPTGGSPGPNSRSPAAGSPGSAPVSGATPSTMVGHSPLVGSYLPATTAPPPQPYMYPVGGSVPMAFPMHPQMQMGAVVPGVPGVPGAFGMYGAPPPLVTPKIDPHRQQQRPAPQ